MVTSNPSTVNFRFTRDPRRIVGPEDGSVRVSLAAAIAIDYFSRSRTTSEVFWARATARVFPSGDH
jgi:hypothetical protein